MSTQHQNNNAVIALTRIAFLANILPYFIDDLKPLCAARRTHSSWKECIEVYGSDIWKRVAIIVKEQPEKQDLLYSFFKNRDCFANIKWFFTLLVLQGKYDLNVTCCHRNVPLLLAIQFENLPMLEFLVTLKPAIDLNKQCPLHRLVDSTHKPEFRLAAIKVLIDAGANIELRDGGSEHTPLLKACYTGNVEIMDFLLSRGADPTAVDVFGDSVLHFAIWCAAKVREQCVRVVLSSKRVDVNYTNKNGQSALHRAALSPGCESVIKLLLENGADPRIVDRNGKTAQQLAQGNELRGNACTLGGWQL